MTLEGLICAVQEQAFRTNSVKHGTYKTQVSLLCRLGKEKTKIVTHIVGACTNLAKNQYMTRHDKVANKLHGFL